MLKLKRPDRLAQTASVVATGAVLSTVFAQAAEPVGRFEPKAGDWRTCMDPQARNASGRGDPLDPGVCKHTITSKEITP